MKLNNIDMEKVNKTVEEWKKNNSVLIKNIQINGEWSFDTNPQFSTRLKFEKGETILKIDSPSFMGGEGAAPSPLQICLAGIASCYIGTIASLAAEKNVVMEKLSIKTSATYDLSKTFGLSDNPILKEITFYVKIKTGAEKEKIEEIIELAKQRCPAMYSLTNPIEPSIIVEKE